MEKEEFNAVIHCPTKRDVFLVLDRFNNPMIDRWKWEEYWNLECVRTPKR